MTLTLNRLWDSDEKPSEKLCWVFSRAWTEHSSRFTVATWASSLGAPGSTIDKLGFWNTGKLASDAYIRTFRELPTEVQSRVAEFGREMFQGIRKENLGESRAIDKLERALREHKVDDEEVELIKSLLTVVCPSEGSATPKAIGWQVNEDEKLGDTEGQGSSESEIPPPNYSTKTL